MRDDFVNLMSNEGVWFFFSFFTGKANQNSLRWLILLTFRGPQGSFKLFVASL